MRRGEAGRETPPRAVPGSTAVPGLPELPGVPRGSWGGLKGSLLWALGVPFPRGNSRTTLGTFFSLILSPHQGAASIGLLLTISIFWLLVLSLFLLPNLLAFFSRRGLLPPRAVLSPDNQE